MKKRIFIWSGILTALSLGIFLAIACGPSNDSGSTAASEDTDFVLSGDAT